SAGTGINTTASGLNLSGVAASNYQLSSNSASTTANITPKDAAVTPAVASKTYGSADPTLSGTLSGFLAADSVTASYSRTAGETVGTYTISATLSPAAVLGNYNVTYSTANFTINKKDATVATDEKSKTYGSADPALSGTLTGFLAADGVSASYSRASGEAVGTYAITASLSPAGVLGNYNITNAGGTFTINKKDASVTPAVASKIYGSADPTLSGTMSGFLAGDSMTASYSRTAGEAVGTYTISATLSPAAVLGNYHVTYSTSNFTINKKDATLATDDKSKTYGSADPALTGTLTGFLATDGVTASYSRAAGEPVGTYAISATLSPAAVLGNYNITNAGATFTITKKDASVTPAVASKIYGSADPTLSGTLSGFLAGDSVTASYSRTAGEA